MVYVRLVTKYHELECGVKMNEERKTKKFQAYINTIEKRLASMNRGSKTLIRIASAVLLAGLLSAGFFVISSLFGLRLLENQPQMVEWLIIYSLRVWVMLVCGSLILDYLVGGQNLRARIIHPSDDSTKKPAFSALRFTLNRL